MMSAKPATIHNMRSALIRSNGLTVQDDNLIFCDDGYQVSTFEVSGTPIKSLSVWTLLATVLDRDLINFGIWHDGTNYILDIGKSLFYSDLNHALDEAVKYKQLAIYDWTNKKNLYVADYVKLPDGTWTAKADFKCPLMTSCPVLTGKCPAAPSVPAPSFKVGDTVRLKASIKEPPHYFTPDMTFLVGGVSTVVISKVDELYDRTPVVRYAMPAGGSRYIYITDIELVSSDPIPKTTVKDILDSLSKPPYWDPWPVWNVKSEGEARAFIALVKAASTKSPAMWYCSDEAFDGIPIANGTHYTSHHTMDVYYILVPNRRTGGIMVRHTADLEKVSGVIRFHL